MKLSRALTLGAALTASAACGSSLESERVGTEERNNNDTNNSSNGNENNNAPDSRREVVDADSCTLKLTECGATQVGMKTRAAVMELCEMRPEANVTCNFGTNTSTGNMTIFQGKCQDSDLGEKVEEGIGDGVGTCWPGEGVVKCGAQEEDSVLCGPPTDQEPQPEPQPEPEAQEPQPQTEEPLIGGTSNCDPDEEEVCQLEPESGNTDYDVLHTAEEVVDFCNNNPEGDGVCLGWNPEDNSLVGTEFDCETGRMTVTTTEVQSGIPLTEGNIDRYSMIETIDGASCVTGEASWDNCACEEQ